ncbi:hypothetical protein RUM43_009350 [Polyplax serrata]|uniref:Uncharacterized protein n=1 Tax=Polyplax serrata TaxID=468196 RepID=A0AAN8PIC8_POLSC
MPSFWRFRLTAFPIFAPFEIYSLFIQERKKETERQAERVCFNGRKIAQVEEEEEEEGIVVEKKKYIFFFEVSPELT